MNQSRYSKHRHSLRQKIQRIRAEQPLPEPASPAVAPLPSATVAAGAGSGVSDSWRPADGYHTRPAQVIGPDPRGFVPSLADALGTDWESRAQTVRDDLLIAMDRAGVKP